MNRKVAWRPLEGSQQLAMTCPANEILLDGTRGGGKTEVQLMMFRRYVGVGYGQFWRGIIFDRHYKSLDDLISKSKKYFPFIGSGAKFLASKDTYKWVWPTGEELLFRVAEKDSDYQKYHGHEYTFIGVNELTKYPTPRFYEDIQSCNRSSFDPQTHSPERPIPPIPLRVVSTTNPNGPGHNWVKNRFIDAAKHGEIIKTKTRIFNPKSQQEENITRSRVRIFSSWRENPFLDPLYIAKLHEISDENIKRAWLQGDWNITVGGMFDDIWKPDTHILPEFKVPTNWRVVRAFDWGSSSPFSVGWYAISNGEEVEIGGSKRCFPRNTIIRIDEIYGSVIYNGTRYGHNRGQKLTAREVARAISSREYLLKESGRIRKPVEPGPADNQIFATAERESGPYANLMASEGIHWARSDKSAGSRVLGIELIRSALLNSLTGEGPGLYVTRNCEAFINTFPSLPRDGKNTDDVDTMAEDHVFDELRYMVLDLKEAFATTINFSFTR